MFGQYRKLSPVGQRIVDRMIESVMSEEQDARDRYLDENYFLSELQSAPAAAGPGCAFIDTPPEYMFIKKNGYNESADALIRVSGASMEPQYHNGDLVYIKYTQSVEDGDIVICSTADGAVIKQMLIFCVFSGAPSSPLPRPAHRSAQTGRTFRICKSRPGYPPELWVSLPLLLLYCPVPKL